MCVLITELNFSVNLQLVSRYLDNEDIEHNRVLLAETLWKKPTDWKALLLSNFFWRGQPDSEQGSRMVRTSNSTYL